MRSHIVAVSAFAVMLAAGVFGVVRDAGDAGKDREPVALQAAAGRRGARTAGRRASASAALYCCSTATNRCYREPADSFTKEEVVLTANLSPTDAERRRVEELYESGMLDEVKEWIRKAKDAEREPISVHWLYVSEYQGARTDVQNRYQGLLDSLNDAGSFSDTRQRVKTALDTLAELQAYDKAVEAVFYELTTKRAQYIRAQSSYSQEVLRNERGGESFVQEMMRQTDMSMYDPETHDLGGAKFRLFIARRSLRSVVGAMTKAVDVVNNSSDLKTKVGDLAKLPSSYIPMDYRAIGRSYAEANTRLEEYRQAVSALETRILEIREGISTGLSFIPGVGNIASLTFDGISSGMDIITGVRSPEQAAADFGIRLLTAGAGRFVGTGKIGEQLATRAFRPTLARLAINASDNLLEKAAKKGIELGIKKGSSAGTNYLVREAFYTSLNEGDKRLFNREIKKPGSYIFRRDGPVWSLVRRPPGSAVATTGGTGGGGASRAASAGAGSKNCTDIRPSDASARSYSNQGPFETESACTAVCAKASSSRRSSSSRRNSSSRRSAPAARTATTENVTGYCCPGSGSNRCFKAAATFPCPHATFPSVTSCASACLRGQKTPASAGAAKDKKNAKKK